MADLHDLTALEQGALVRRGETSPLELAEHYLDRVERLDDVGAFVHHTAEQARERAAALGAVAARRGRAALGPAHRGQGPQPHRRASAPPSAPPPTTTSCPRSPTGWCSRMEAAGLVSLGKTAHARVRLALLHRARGAPARRHPLGPHPDGRRLLRGRGRRGGRRSGAARPGLRRRRLDPHPRLLLRPRRPQALARSHQRLPHVRRPGRPGHRRARSPARSATPQPSSTCWPGPAPATLPGRRSPTAPSSTPATASPVGCASPASPSPSSPTPTSTPSVSRPGRTPLDSWSRWATRSSTCRCRWPARPSRSSRSAGRCSPPCRPRPAGREHLLRPLTRWLSERGRVVSRTRVGPGDRGDAPPRR